MGQPRFTVDRRLVIKNIKRIIEFKPLKVQYLYLRETDTGYCLMGKVDDALVNVKPVEKELREYLMQTVERDSLLGVISGTITIKIFGSNMPDKVVRSALIKSKMVQFDCIVNGGKWM